jgi:hypothetical protein
MSKAIETLVLGIVALVVLVAAGPTISRLVQAIVPLVLVVGVVVAILQVVRYLTRQ